MIKQSVTALLLSLGLISLVPTFVYAEENREGYVGVSLTNTIGENIDPQVNAEVMIPFTDWAELRATTDFNNEVDVLPTVSVGMGNAGDLYAGAGLNYEDNCYHFLVRGGADWNLTEKLAGLTYIDYVDDDVKFTAGLGYRFGSLNSGSGYERPVVAPIDRN